ncbi:HemK family protein methyltransferase [Micromonospora sediminicola]|nr:HemK family protein methyltransferase [Micromonospora sediminicola]
MAHPSQVELPTGQRAVTTTDGGGNPPGPSGEPYQDAILAIWRDVLGRSDIDVSDDFLALGDHSLAPVVVARIRRALGVDIPVMDIFECRSVSALAVAVAARSAAAETGARRGVTRRPPDSEPLLSFDQQRLWLESQLLPGVVYNVHARRRLVGQLDVAALEASIRAILARHEALRSRFPTVEGRPVQAVDDPDDNWRIRFEDLTGVPHDDRTVAARRLLDEESTTPFDLAVGPLFRCMLVKVGDDEHLLGVTMHHIVSDTWSIGLFVRELSALYQSGGDVGRADLPPLPVQYRDYATWQRGRLVGETLEKQLRYWRGQLAGAPPVLALPAPQRRTTSQRAEADRIECVLPRAETARLHQLCRAQGVTPFMALLAGLTTVFSRWSGQSDVVIGVPLAGRTHSGTENLIGFFVNVLPFRIDLSGNPTFAELLARVRRVALEGYDHADAPLDALVEDLQVGRDPRRTPLFEVVLNVVGSPEAEQAKGFTVEPMDSPSLFSRFDLSVSAQESDGSLRLQLDFASERCDAAMVRVLVDHLRTLLRGAVDDPTRPILDYPFGPAGDTGDVAAPSGAPSVPAPHLAVERHAGAADRPAVVDGGGEWGYRWLHRAAERVARLLAERNVRPGDPVVVVRRPTAGFVATLLGCLRAGATYVPVDGDEPAGSGVDAAPIVLDPGPTDEVDTGTVDLSALLHEPDDEPDDDPPRTGEEKGPAAGTADWAVERFDLRDADRFAVLSASPHHLMSALCSAFHAGATLVLPDPAATADIGALTRWLRTSAVSVVHLEPPLLRALADQRPGPGLPALRYAFVDNSGGLVPHDVGVLRNLAPACRLVGVYRVRPDGRPRAAYEVPQEWDLGTAPLRIPLGRELPDCPAWLARPSGGPAAVGEVGELVFGELRTGDVGRRWHDGSLEFVSKVGVDPGFDPLETVTTLRDLPEVRDAVVTERAGPDGRRRLVGYVTGPDPDLGSVAMRKHLMTRLPDYLIPDQILVLCGLPLTPGGTYDLAALPEADLDAGDIDDYVAPRTPMERQLVGILQELLGIDRVGIYDSFFELGGFSLLATQLTTRIRADFNVELAMRDVFESPTVNELAQLIVHAQGELSGTDDLEALLAEIEGAGTVEAPGGPAPAVPSAEEDRSGTYDRVVARLRESAVFSPDKPDETPETSAQALWYAAVGSPRSVTAVTLPLPTLSDAQERILHELVGRRVAGEPLAYLTGRASFMGLELLAETGALIPRRETELLGGAALDLARELATDTSGVRLLDLGTGAGNLAVSIAVHEPRSRVWAADLEAGAVAVARRNAAFHKVDDRLVVAQGDLFAALDGLSPAPSPFDLVVCNPPYMPTDKARSLPTEVGGHEPTAAFDGGDIGLSVVYRLIAEAPRHLVPGGWLCFELGAGMGRVVEKRLAAQGAYGEIRKVTDQYGTTRVILAQRLP